MATGRAVLSRPMAFGFIAYAFGVAMLGTTLPSPLYPLYQRQFGFGSLLTTVIYAVYAGGVLAALLLFGRASDVLGRRRMLLIALFVSALSAIVFLTDGGLGVLFLGRILSGLSAGVCTGTATVALVEMTGVDRRNHATVIATVVNMLGLGCGPLLAGFLAEYGPVPLRLPYGVHLLLLIPAAIGVWRSPETVEVQPGARTRLQRLVVPPQARTAFVPAALSVFAAFAVFGLLTAIEPGFLATLLHLPNLALAGTAVFFMFAGSALGQVGLARMPGQIALPAGCLVLVAGLASIALALVMHSLPPLLIGTVVVGVGQGMSFRAGMAAITQNSPTERRAETVSSFFVVIYVGISLPVILVGLATQAWGLRTAGIAFTIAVAVLAITALVAILRMAPRNQTHHLESVKQR